MGAIIDILLWLAKRATPFLKTKAGIYLVISILSLGGAGFIGWKIRDYAADAERLSSVENAIAQANEQWEVDKAILEDSVEAQKEIEYVFKYIEKEVIKVEVDECDDLGDGWRRVYNDAAEAASTASTN